MLKLFFREAPKIIKLSEEEKDFINTQYSFICDNIEQCKVTKLKEFFRVNSTIFTKLVEPTNLTNGLYDLVVKKMFFAINYENLRIIYGLDFETRPFTTVENGDPDLRRYVTRDINALMDLFPDNSIGESEQALISLSKYSSVSNEKLLSYFSKQTNKINFLGEVDASQYQMFFDSNIVSPTWANVREFLAHGNELITISSFINQHAEDLAKEKLISDDDELQKSILNNNDVLTLESYKNIAPAAFYSVDVNNIENLEESRVNILLDNKLIKYSAEANNFISKLSSDLFAKYLIYNYAEFMSDEEPFEFIKSNALGLEIMNSSISDEHKAYFLKKSTTILNTDDKNEYAKLICNFYNTYGKHDDFNFDLITIALENYQDNNSWFTKIDLINKTLRSDQYFPDRTKRMVNSLGDPYTELNDFSHHTLLDNNGRNNELVNYLKEHAPFISNVIPKGEHIKITYKKNPNE